MSGDLHGGPVVNNLPCNDAENEGSVLGWGTEILGVAHGDQKRKGTAWVGSRLSPTLPAGYLSAVYKLGSLRWQLVLMLP